MDTSEIWWIVAGTVVVLELATGTFFFLLIALGLVAGAIAAYLGAAIAIQLFAAALVGGGSVALWTWLKRRAGVGRSADRSEELLLDIGQQVTVARWNADGTSTVQYRGAAWTVVGRPGSSLVPGNYRVAEVVGSQLWVDPA